MPHGNGNGLAGQVAADGSHELVHALDRLSIHAHDLVAGLKTSGVAGSAFEDALDGYRIGGARGPRGIGRAGD
jgi:hypothetical protein